MTRPAIMQRISVGLPVTVAPEDTNVYSTATSNLVADDYSLTFAPDLAAPTFPVSWDLGLNSLAAAQLTNCILYIDHDAPGEYTSSFGTGADMSTTGSDFTIRAHATWNAGVPPADADAGWVVLKTVTANTFSQLTYVLGDISAYKHLKVRWTAKNGTNGIKAKFELFDASAAVGSVYDAWLILGDSWTVAGAGDIDAPSAAEWTSGGPIRRKFFTQSKNTRWALFLNGGSGGQNMGFGATNIAGLLAPNLAAVHYVILNYGVNDANQPALTGAQITQFNTDLTTAVDYCLGQGKEVLVAYVGYTQVAGNAGDANAVALNAEIDKVVEKRGLMRPIPSLYSVFKFNPGLLSTDNLHPGYDTGVGGGLGGYTAWQQELVRSMWASAYENYVSRVRPNIALTAPLSLRALMFQDRTWQAAALPVVGNVTVALTGVQINTAVGTLGVSHDQALAGNAMTGSVGTLAPSLTIAITGVSAAPAVGTLSPTLVVTITGVVATGSVGDLTPGTTVTIVGNAAVGSVGTLAPGTTVTLVGNGVIASVGNVTASGGDVVPKSRKSILISFTDTYRIN